jgi:hypothetical protein
MDAIPFEKSLAALMELWAHNRTPGLSYARIVYHYARPGAVDDYRALMPSDLRVPPLPKRTLVAAGGASGAKFHLATQLQPQATAGAVETVPFALATQLEIVQWPATKGEKLTLKLPVEKDGRTTIHLVAVHRPDGATLRAAVDGHPLRLAEGAETFRLRSAHAPRVLNVNFRTADLKAGTRDLTLECVEPGAVGLDYVWVKQP